MSNEINNTPPALTGPLVTPVPVPPTPPVLRPSAIRQVNLPLRRQIAEELLGPVEWVSDSEGDCTCPGAGSHTNPGDDSKVYLDCVPTIHCLHQSCHADVNRGNQRLRGKIGAIESRSSQPTEGQVSEAARTDGNRPLVTNQNESRNEEKESGKKLLKLARANLPQICATYSIDPEEWYDRSPIDLPENQQYEDWRLLLGVLPPDDRVWIGERTQTGKPEHINRFREVSTWLAQERKCPGPFICPANFRPGTFTRANASVADTNFIIVESDTLSKAEVSSVFLWLQESWHLVAIVDSGNKSLHAWFQRPLCVPTEVWSKNKVVLEGLDCDTALLRPSQPCRLPGFRRADTFRWQHLRYLNHMESLL